MRKRILAALLSTAILLQGSISASAQEYTTEGTAECRISCEVTSSYTVSIPAAVGLTYSASAGTATGTFRVGVKGDLLLNQMVQVKPSHLSGALSEGINGNFHDGTLKGEATSASLGVTVNLRKNKWHPVGTTPLIFEEEYSEISATEFVYSDGTVTTDEVEVADTYTGTLVFSFGLEDYERRVLP